jgi:hypothetical protein
LDHFERFLSGVMLLLQSQDTAKLLSETFKEEHSLRVAQ